MKSFFFIENKDKDCVIEIFSENSQRFNFFKSILMESEIKVDSKLNISKDLLNKGIVALLNKKEEKDIIDFGNRFSEEQCYEVKNFEGVNYKLETSGYDNLIIFAINILENIDANLVLRKHNK